jgi:hypothetical protein
MAAVAKDNVSYRLLNRLSNLVICSSCLRAGKVTPVPQIISGRHSLTNECASCRSQNDDAHSHPCNLARLRTLPR